MWPESGETPKPLRSGLTTGTCATACCIAAAERLFSDRSPESVTVTLPKGKEVSLVIDCCETIGNAVRASTIKDAGDDPDVTHGARVFVELRKCDRPGIHFKAADGVGVVTRAGLSLEVGEPAINTVPRQMMRQHLERQALRFDYRLGLEVSVGVENGELLAQKTMNSRLGIKGGLTIRLFGLSRRYALRECISIGLMTRGSAEKYVKGRMLIDVISDAGIYQREGNLNSVRR